MAETLELGAVEVDKDRMEFLQRIIQESERLGLRIDEVLTVGRSPEVSPRTPVAVDRLAEEVVEQWTPRFSTEGAVLETDLVCCPPVAADPALLRDALSNLVDNALKYMRPDRMGRCLVRTSFDDHWVKIEVIDNGLGVPVAMRKRIFERFRRVEGPGRGSAGGHGLGLAFVAEAASAHSGLVECSDGIEGGACFVMKLRKT